MQVDYLVVGAGFRGFCDALNLSDNGLNKVAMIDTTPFFGGVFFSHRVKDFYVDKGVHVFDSVPQELGNIVEDIMDGRIKNVEFVSESAFNGKVTQGYSLPDLSSISDLTVKQAITHELLTLASQKPDFSKAQSLGELFTIRYGDTAGKIFCDIFRRVYQADPLSLEPHAITKTSLGRLKHLDDKSMMVLKSNEWLDTVLAARRKTVGKVDDFVSIYPDTGEAMAGWCVRAEKWLQQKGIEVLLGEKIIGISQRKTHLDLKTDKREIEAKKLVWSNDNANPLSELIGSKIDVNSLQSASSLLLITFITQAKFIKDFTYLQNFDTSALSYRTASAGVFSGQISKAGDSFITCECPIPKDSDIWNDFEEFTSKVWQECKELGVVDDRATIVDCDVAKVPVAIKMPNKGYTERLTELADHIGKNHERIVFRKSTPFYRREIYLDSKELVNQL